MTDGWCAFAIRRPVTARKFWPGNQGRDAVVLHVSEGTAESLIGWFLGGSPTSAHFGIGPDGAQVSSGKGSPKEMVVTTMDRAPWQVLVNRAGTERQYNLYYSYRVGRGLTYASERKNAQMNACPNLQ